MISLYVSLTADIPLGRPDGFDDNQNKEREARFTVRNTDLGAFLNEQENNYIVCICLWMIYFEDGDVLSSLEGMGETLSFEQRFDSIYNKMFVMQYVTDRVSRQPGKSGNVSTRFSRSTKSSELNSFWWTPRSSYVQPPTTTSCSYLVGTTQRPGSSQLHHELVWSQYLKSMSYPTLPSIAE